MIDLDDNRSPTLRRPASRRSTGLAIGGLATLLVAGIAVAALTGQVDAQDPKSAKKVKPPQTITEPAAQPPAMPVSPAPATSLPVHTETTTYDQWTVVCQDKPDTAPKRTCSAVLKVVDPNRKQVVFAWVLARTPEGRVATIMQAPTGVQVQRGITLKLGEAGPSHTMPFTSCEPQNCEVSQALDDGTLRELEAAPQATATIYAKDGRGIQFNMPLKGIDRALAAIRA